MTTPLVGVCPGAISAFTRVFNALWHYGVVRPRPGIVKNAFR